MSDENQKLSDEDIGELAKFFYLLMEIDMRNKQEGKYDASVNAEEGKQ